MPKKRPSQENGLKRKLQKIQLDAFGRMPWTKAKKTNLYINSQPAKRGQMILAGHQQIPIDRDTIVVFADDAPLYNWGHPCRYLLYDPNNGEPYDEIEASFPPDLMKPAETFKVFHEPVVHATLEQMPYAKLPHWADRIGGRLTWYARGHRYAVLFSGASNNRHVNDLEFLYRTLVDVYGFAPDRIYVLNYDGTVNYSGTPKPVGNWPGDDKPYRLAETGVMSGEGTKSDFEDVLDELKGRLTQNDFLLIHTNNHGGHDGTESYLCTYTGPSYTASDFADKLAELPHFAQLMVMMEQCHSGGFNIPIINNSTADETTVASACEEDRSSIGGAEFDPFARDWISAVTGTDPYGSALDYDPDSDSDGVVSASETFSYANAVKHAYDTPVYNEAPTGCGDDMHLGRPELVLVLDRFKKYLKRYYEFAEPIGPWPWPEPEPRLGPTPPGPRPGPGPYVYEDLARRVGELEKLTRH